MTLCLDKPIEFPNDVQSIADDWLLDVSDDIVEPVDEFRNIRNKREETGRTVGSDQDIDGVRLVFRKKQKKGDDWLMSDSVGDSEGGFASSSGVKVKKRPLPAAGVKGKAKLPFHIPTIPKPLEEYSILVNNSIKPFDHVWLQRSEDGQRFVHPLEKLSVMDFVDKDVADIEHVQPPSIESTPFKLVEEVKDLKELAAKLSSVNEFVVKI
ncbi:hypothetical protein F3Y22_tig00111807pilonHSYRG00023 [Hibiscus syriacus]|uniref:Uncharacterized protein n=1 Tax=Hibiscus syriacus TaxID=106335 RepID=A0A6A2XTK0_HIBSY|nr:hypothetical protein F3Y22_tig00111807pilonHSYRG00023 [Hibiscus syriacus]